MSASTVANISLYTMMVSIHGAVALNQFKKACMQNGGEHEGAWREGRCRTTG